jgi:hypothetical protein
MKRKISEQAKMNSSDWSGLDQEDAEGWTQVHSRSSKKMMLRKQKLQEKHQAENDSPGQVSDRRLRSGSASRSRSSSGSRAARSRSHSRVSDAVVEEGMPANPAVEPNEQVVEPELDATAVTKGKTRRSRSSSSAHGNAVVSETPFREQVSSSRKEDKARVVKVNAADGMTLKELFADASQTGERCKPRDIDPSSRPPAPAVVHQVAEMLREDPGTALPVKLGIPSTTRREAALKRLKRTLQIRYLDAEKLLTCSALTHDDGQESYQHALALGKYLKHGALVQDEAEAHRVYLRNQVYKLGYSAAQADLAIEDLEASLGLLNVTASELQGWLVRQAVAYNQAHNVAGNASSHICHSRCCQPGEDKTGDAKPPHLRRAETILCAHGMNDVAAALRQAASNLSPSATISSRSTVVQNSDPRAPVNSVSSLHQDDSCEDPSWNRSPAVKSYLAVRDAILRAVQEWSTLPPHQLLRMFDAHVASQPTMLEAVRSFPSVCQVKCELAGLLHQELEKNQCSIRDLELGNRILKAELLERGTAQVMQRLEGPGNRQIAEAEFERAYKRLGDSNEAVQQVLQLMKDVHTPTPSWRKQASKENDTPRALGASCRVGESLATGMSTKRREAGRATARLAAQQEIQAGHPAPPKESRYRNADAIASLRKMLKEDPELSNLPAEQQLRLAARRINRRIDFQDQPTKDSAAVKRSASEAADVFDEDNSVNSVKEPVKAMKARRSLKGGVGNDGSGGSDPSSASSSGTNASSDGDSRQSGYCGTGSSSQSEGSGAENSDSMGSPCDSEADSRDASEDYDTSDGFCVSDDDTESGDSEVPESKNHGSKKAKKKPNKPAAKESSASKRASSVNSLGTPKKSETSSSASQGGNIYFGEDELKKWTTGSEKYKQGFNWPAYIHHKQNYDNYCQFKGVHAARTFKSVIHARLVPALCGFCGLRRRLWKDYEDATVILAIEKALRPSKSTDFALELKQLHIADDREQSLMQNYTAFFENFSYKVAEAEDANRSIKPNVIRSTFKAAIAGHEILKLWLEEVPWRGLNKANARLLRKLREVRSWEQLQRKGVTSVTKKPRFGEGESGDTKPRQEGKRVFRGTRAGRSFALKKRTVCLSGSKKGHSNFGTGSSGKRAPLKFQSGRTSGEKRKHPGLDQRGEAWHSDKDLFECFNSPCNAPFCQRCGRHGHLASECRIPDDAAGINLKGYYQEEKKGKARIAGPPPRNNSGFAAEDGGQESDENIERGKNNAHRGSGRRCLQ